MSWTVLQKKYENIASSLMMASYVIPLVLVNVDPHFIHSTKY